MQLQSTNHIPSQPGIYIFKDTRGEILYIGKAKNLKKRVQQYFTPGSVWKQEMVEKAEEIAYMEVNSESDALTLEENLIKQHLPEYNKLLRYNSNHIFIKFSKEDFPTVTLSRTRRKDKATYIGPKQNTKELRKLLQYLRQIFKFRTISSTEFHKGVLTTDFYLGLDAGRSVIAKMNQKNAEAFLQQAKSLWFVLEKSYDEYKQEYSKMITSVQKFFEGDTKVILTSIQETIKKAAEKQQYERCAQLRDIYHYIETFGQKQEVVFSRPVDGNIIWIEQIHAYWVVIFVKIFDGKIVDVIRQRIPTEERGLESIIASCKAEYWVKTIKSTPTYSEQVAESSILSSLNRSLLKIEQNSLKNLLQKFVQSYISSTLFEEDNLINQLLIGLKERYGLKKVPFHIECIDISHLSGGWISGGLSCFKSGVPYPKGYRKYKIQTVWQDGQSDDYQSLREVVTRRMLHEPYPDLLIIDGGKGQINAVFERLTKIFGSLFPFDLISIGKGDARKRAGKIKGEKEIVYKFGSIKSEVGKQTSRDAPLAHPQSDNLKEYELTYDLLDQLFLKARDEAHRFSNKYRKEQMKKDYNI